MADKQTKLQVVLAMLDKATAPLNAFNKRVQAMTDPIRKVSNRLALLGESAGLGKLKTAAGGVGKAFSDVARQAAYIGAAIGGAGFLFKRAFIDVAAEFERFETILGTIEGSSDKAKQSMDWISAFAAKTPYELAEVTDAFVKLRAYGMDPTNGLLKSLGDTAAAMGKPVMAAVEAIADAVTGENERLKEFGIKARKIGDQIVYEYTENGKTMRARAKANSREQIQATLEAIFNKKYAGAMDKLSGTWGGMMSNISDQWTRFAKMVMDSGPFEILRTKLANFLKKLDEMAASGELQRIAEVWGKKLSDGFEKAWAVGEKLYRFLVRFVDMVGGVENAMMILAAVAAGPLVLSLVTLGQAAVALGMALWATPIGWFLGIVVAIAAAALLIYKNWEPIKKFLSDLWNDPMEAMKTFFALAKKLFEYSPLGLIFKGVSMGVDKLFGPGKPVGAGASAAATGAQTNTNNAAVKVDFQNVPRGVQVTPGNRNTAPLDLSMGYAMAAP